MTIKPVAPLTFCNSQALSQALSSGHCTNWPIRPDFDASWRSLEPCSGSLRVTRTFVAAIVEVEKVLRASFDAVVDRSMDGSD